MSNGHRNKSFTPPSTPQPVAETPPLVLSEVTTTESPDLLERESKPWWRRCKHCWPTRRGIGYSQGTNTDEDDDPLEPRVGVRYYKCDSCEMNFRRIFERRKTIVEKWVTVVIE